MICSLIIIFLMIVYLIIGLSVTFFANNEGKAEYEAEVIESSEKGSVVKYCKNGRSVYEDIVEIYPVGSEIIVKGYNDNLSDMVEVDFGTAFELGIGSFCAMISCIFYLVLDYMGKDLSFSSFMFIILAGFFIFSAGAIKGNLTALKNGGELIKDATLEDVDEFKMSGSAYYSPSYTYVKDGKTYKIDKQRFCTLRDADREIGQSYDIIYNKNIQMTRTVRGITQYKINYCLFFLLSVSCLFLAIL